MWLKREIFVKGAAPMLAVKRSVGFITKSVFDEEQYPWSGRDCEGSRHAFQRIP